MIGAFQSSRRKMSDANHLSGPLRKWKFTSTGHCLWFVIGGFRCVLRGSMFQGSLLVILLWPKPDVNIPNFFYRFHPWTSDFQISMKQKYWRFRLNFEIVKVRLSAVCKQSFLSYMPLTVYKTFAWQTFASLRLFTCLVYVSTYCVPIAHLRQNKPFPLLYLGYAQMITLFTAQSKIFLPAAILRVACEQQMHFRSSLLSLRKRKDEKRRPEMRLLFAGYTSRGIKLAASQADRLRSACSLAKSM